MTFWNSIALSCHASSATATLFRAANGLSSRRRRADRRFAPAAGEGIIMRSLPVGSLVAAIVMFMLGYVFFGLLHAMMLAPLDAATATALQGALGANLAEAGTYMIPSTQEAWMAGPGALVQFTPAGGAPSMAMAMGMGFGHFLISAFLIGLALKGVGGDEGRRMKVALMFGLAASFFMHLGDPVWYGFGWRAALFVFAADGVIFIAGGLILAKWFTADEANG
jgi:hypothetical protein